MIRRIAVVLIALTLTFAALATAQQQQCTTTCRTDWTAPGGQSCTTTCVPVPNTLAGPNLGQTLANPRGNSTIVPAPTAPTAPANPYGLPSPSRCVTTAFGGQFCQ